MVVDVPTPHVCFVPCSAHALSRCDAADGLGDARGFVAGATVAYSEADRARARVRIVVTCPGHARVH
jgi:hypothetical protein